jgi:hypothetical protein
MSSRTLPALETAIAALRPPPSHLARRCVHAGPGAGPQPFVCGTGAPSSPAASGVLAVLVTLRLRPPGQGSASGSHGLG